MFLAQRLCLVNGETRPATLMQWTCYEFWKVLHAKRITARPGKENAPSTSPKTRTEVARLARYFADAGVPNEQFVDQAYYGLT